MAKRITKLTAEQTALLPTFREEWLQRGLATGPCDRPRIEAAARTVYEAAGLDAPQYAVWMSSPMGGVVAASILSESPEANAVRRRLWEDTGSPIGTQLRAQIGRPCEQQLDSELRGQLRHPLYSLTWNPTRSHLRDDLKMHRLGQLVHYIHAELNPQLRSNLATELLDQIRFYGSHFLSAQLSNSIRSTLADQVGWDLSENHISFQQWNVIHTQYGWVFSGQFLAYWVAWAIFLRDELGLKVTPQQSQWLDGMATLCDTGWWFALKNAIVFTERPHALHRDGQGRLHATDGMAIRYGDGWGLWAVHGVRVDEEIVCHPETLTPETIFGYRNTEVRRVAIERFGWDRFVTEARLSRVDTCPDPANAPYTLDLYDVPEDLFQLGTPIRLLLCTNASPERDGTRRRYGLTVPADESSALSAAAWSFESSPETYGRLARAS